MKLFILNFPDDLHHRLKVLAAQEKSLLWKLIVRLIEAGMKKEGK